MCETLLSKAMLLVWLGFTTSCRRTNLRSLARCTLFACSFHAVSPRPGLVKLLALSNFQGRRRSLRDSSFTGHFGQFSLFVIIVDTPVIGASLPTIGCVLLSQVSRTQWLLCADPPPFLVHRRRLDSGMVLSSLIHSTSEANLCWIGLIDSFIGLSFENECFCLSHDIGFVRFA